MSGYFYKNPRFKLNSLNLKHDCSILVYICLEDRMNSVLEIKFWLRACFRSIHLLFCFVCLLVHFNPMYSQRELEPATSCLHVRCPGTWVTYAVHTGYHKLILWHVPLPHSVIISSQLQSRDIVCHRNTCAAKQNQISQPCLAGNMEEFRKNVCPELAQTHNLLLAYMSYAPPNKLAVQRIQWFVYWSCDMCLSILYNTRQSIHVYIVPLFEHFPLISILTSLCNLGIDPGWL